MRRNIYDRLSARRVLEQQRLAQERLEQPTPAPPALRERYHTNELSFARPSGATDNTFHVLTLADPAPSPFSVVIGRTCVAADQGLETLAQQLLAELGQVLAHLEWLEPLCPTQVAGVEARRVEFRWRQHGQPVHQLQVLFLHQDEQRHCVLMQVTATGKGPEGITTHGRAAFESVIDTLQLRQWPNPANPVASP